MSPARKPLAEARGFVFDLDGCVWTGEVLMPGAAEVLALLRGRGRGVCFLTIGGPELEQAVLDGGHSLVPVEQFREAGVVVVGNDFAFTYERLTAAARAVAGGAAFLTPNIDPRLPLEDGDFLPGCGAIVEAVATAAGVRPLVVGKPEPPLFELALRRMGVTETEAVMVGDSVDSDVRGARRIGMTAVLFAPKGGPDGVAHYMVRSMAQLRRLLR